MMEVAVEDESVPTNHATHIYAAHHGEQKIPSTDLSDDEWVACVRGDAVGREAYAS